MTMNRTVELKMGSPKHAVESPLGLLFAGFVPSFYLRDLGSHMSYS